MYSADSLKYMDNPRFIDEGTIPLVQDEDYDHYKTPDICRVGETSFTEPDATEETSTLQLTQKAKQNKLTVLYKHLNITGNSDLWLNRFRFTTDPKKGATVFEFYKSDKWVSLTKQTGEFLATNTKKDRLKAMKKFLGTVETPPELEKSFEVATKIKREFKMDIEMESIPLQEISSLVEDIHVNTRYC